MNVIDQFWNRPGLIFFGRDHFEPTKIWIKPYDRKDPNCVLRQYFEHGSAEEMNNNFTKAKNYWGGVSYNKNSFIEYWCINKINSELLNSHKLNFVE